MALLRADMEELLQNMTKKLETTGTISDEDGTKVVQMLKSLPESKECNDIIETCENVFKMPDGKDDDYDGALDKTSKLSEKTTKKMKIELLLETIKRFFKIKFVFEKSETKEEFLK